MKHFLSLLLSFLLISTSIFAQDPQDSTFQKKKFHLFTIQKKETKKDVIQERDSLLKLIDSLRLEIEEFSQHIELADTLSSDDTLVAGTLDVAESEFMGSDLPVDTDSLMSIWYHQRNLALIENAETDVDLDSTVLLSDIPDSVYIERLRKMNSFISLPYNKIIKNYIISYTQRIPNKTEVILGLSTYYMPLFEEIFDSYGLPLELKSMAIIESALNPKAVSRVNAKGMWQFMYGTAIRYKLTINSYVDERLDPIKSGYAAAQYLRDSYLIFGDWVLAIASYNCGPGNVNKAIRRSGGSKDFWEIYPYLPRETRGYIPSFIAALYVLNYYKEHQLTPVQVQMPIHTDTIKVNKMLHFEQISHFTGMTVKELRDLNPQYMHDIIPGVEREYILRIPYNYTNSFVEHEKEMYSYKDSVYFNPAVLKKIKETGSATSNRIVHKVKSGETLSHIALKYRVKVSDIQRWNGIKTNIRVGQKIVIYTAGGPSASKSSSTGTSTKPATTTSGGYVMYTVRKGDTLWDIAKLFPGVSMNDIMEINGFTSNSKIYPGAKIKIKKSN